MVNTLKYLIDNLFYEKTKQELCNLAFMDSMTGVYNRNALGEMRVSIDSMECYISIIDIDNLKRINDTKGHMVGDEVIKIIANELKSISNYVFRLGGDEFLIINNKPITINIQGASYGSVYKSKKTTLHNAMGEADSRMYHYKQSKTA